VNLQGAKHFNRIMVPDCFFLYVIKNQQNANWSVNRENYTVKGCFDVYFLGWRSGRGEDRIFVCVPTW